MQFHRPPDLDRGVFGVAAGEVGQTDLRQSLARQLLVQQQGQKGMIVGRRRQFDLAAVLKTPIQGDHLANQFQMLVEQPGLLGLGEAASLVAQAAQAAVLVDGQGMNPGQVEPDLQIAEIAIGEAPQRFLGRVLPGAATQEQLLIAGVGPNHLGRIGHEEVVEQKEAIDLVQPVRRLARQR